MKFENTQNNALAKLPMLKLREYEMWEIRIKQYFQIQDYALWEVIENGNSWVPIPVTTPQKKTGKKSTDDGTAQVILQRYHSTVCDAQSMFAAIKSRFGGHRKQQRRH
ncbi:hypothetical protein Tco_1110750 [Tanacetum coccineum]|uniref:Uncharacterized protein n=1 Tax=Tanacetum coccineum TaxID=301880 RepID=A0ABQ5IJP4_9ASTR